MCVEDLKDRANYLKINQKKAKEYAEKEKTIVSLIKEGDYYRIEKGVAKNAIELFLPY